LHTNENFLLAGLCWAVRNDRKNMGETENTSRGTHSPSRGSRTSFPFQKKRFLPHSQPKKLMFVEVEVASVHFYVISARTNLTDQKKKMGSNFPFFVVAKWLTNVMCVVFILTVNENDSRPISIFFYFVKWKTGSLRHDCLNQFFLYMHPFWCFHFV
jgi:hypothetical protein